MLIDMNTTTKKPSNYSLTHSISLEFPNLLRGHPEGLEKHIQVFKGKLPSVVGATIPTAYMEAFIQDFWEVDNIIFWFHLHGETFTMIVGGDLVHHLPDYTLNTLHDKLNDCRHWIMEAYRYLNIDPNMIRVDLPGIR